MSIVGEDSPSEVPNVLASTALIPARPISKDFGLDADELAQSEPAKPCEIEIVRRRERRQHWKLITVPTITIGATAATAISGDSGFGVISSITIPETNQSVVKLTAKSRLGTFSQYRSAMIVAAGAIAAPIM
jgi:hypothetical protein